MTEATPTPSRQKGKHLTLEDRLAIQTRFRDGRTITEIARLLNCVKNTIRRELVRGRVLDAQGNPDYDPRLAHDRYCLRRLACHRPPRVASPD